MNNVLSVSAIINLTKNLLPWWNVIVEFGQLIGFAFIIGSLILLIKRGQGGSRASLGLSVSMVIAGIMLFQLTSSLNTLSMTVFQTASVQGNVLAYTGGGTSSATAMSIAIRAFAVLVAQLVGLIGFIKGLTLLSKTGEDMSLMGPATTRIVGGFLAINVIPALVGLAAST